MTHSPEQIIGRLKGDLHEQQERLGVLQSKLSNTQDEIKKSREKIEYLQGLLGDTAESGELEIARGQAPSESFTPEVKTHADQTIVQAVTRILEEGGREMKLAEIIKIAIRDNVRQDGENIVGIFSGILSKYVKRPDAKIIKGSKRGMYRLKHNPRIFIAGNTGGTLM